MRYGVFFVIPAFVAAMAFFQSETSEGKSVSAASDDIAMMGRDTLMFPVAPKPQPAPVMPDLPWQLPEMSPEPVPIIADTGAVAALTMQSIKPLVSNAVATRAVSDPSMRRVTAVSLNMRSGPSSRFPSITALRQGDRAVISGRAKGGWVPIRLVKSGRRGWVFHRYLAPLES